MQDDEETHTSSPSTGTRHQCYLCSRTYERHDHLSRHLKSHDNERSYRCADCGKGFNRADLLNRHRAAHAKTSTGEIFRRRTPRACEACIKAKTKCDDDRPCKRCRTREIQCVESEGRSAETRDESSASQLHTCTGNNGMQLATPASLPRQSEESNMSQSGMTGMTPFQPVADPFANQMPMPDFTFPDFFEQIMMSDMNSGPNLDYMMPPNVSEFTQDLNMDSLDFDFRFLASGLTRPPSAQGNRENPVVHVEEPTSEPSQSDARLRSEALKRAPWSWNHWIPDRNQTAFTGQEEINVQEDRIDSTDQHISPSMKRSIHYELDHEARDRMIRVVTQTASSRVAMPSFPSLELLEDLIDIYLLQDANSIDSFIHAPTFSGRKTLTELLMAMVAGGSRYIALEPVWKMGLVMQEVVRLAISEVFEGDNSNTRRLQPLQAYFLWIQVGAWSGFRRKTEIACSFSQPLVTMLSWSNSFTKFRYVDFIPHAEDSDQVLEEKWASWLEQEGRKRYVCRVFLHDSHVTIAHMQNRLVSPSQMLLPLPASQDLWLAPNAHAWRNLYLSKQPPSQQSLPSMMDVFNNLSILDTLPDSIDKPLCILTTCHALAHEITQFRQQAIILANWQQQGRRDRWLTHLNRQRDLLDDITTISAYCDLHHPHISPEILFTVEFLTMSLHASLEEIQTFSGKNGEEEARRVYPRIRTWTEDAESRIAVWHAGQVLRIARTFEKTRLRDFYAVGVYQATISLWVYGMVTSNAARKSGGKSPAGRAAVSVVAVETVQQGTARIFLDDESDKMARSFKRIGQGVPGLRDGEGSFCSLHNSRGVMMVAESILKQNFPESRNGLPPLVENLANLMGELGKLSGR